MSDTKINNSVIVEDIVEMLRGREAKVRELNTKLCAIRRKCAALTIKIGGLLEELKAGIGHGKWELYVEKNLGIPPRTARDYMQLYRRARKLDGIGKIFKTANLAEMSIGELKVWLSKTEASQNARKKTSGTGSPQVKKALMLRLCDGSTIDLKSLRWRDGLLSQEAIENWLSRPEEGSTQPDSKKLEARRQRAVIQIAAGINLACGRANRNAAVELVDSAISTIRQLLEAPAEPQKTAHPAGAKR